MDQQPVKIDFSAGVDTKDDPWTLPVGRFTSLENSIFTTGHRLTKRPGYGKLITAPSNSNYLTTLNSNLTAIGSQVNTYSSSLNNWVNKGTLQSCSLSIIPTIRNSLNQIQSDSVTANGLTLITYTQQHEAFTGLVTQYLYAISDAATGQLLVQPTAIPVITNGSIQGSSRTFLVENYFVIVSPVTVSAVTYLQYFSIPIANISAPSAAQNVTSEVYVPTTSTPGWDGVVLTATNTLVVAYNSTTGAQGVHVATLNSNQIATNSASSTIHTFNNANYVASILSVCADTTVSPNIVYIPFYNANNSTIYTASVYTGFGTITTQFTPVSTATSVTVANLTCAAQNSSCRVFFEIVASYGYDSTIPTHLTEQVDVTSTGSAGSVTITARSVGIASKSFIVNTTIYFLSSYESTYQSTYFLINGSTSTQAAPVVVAKLAYQAGAGYYINGLPSVTITGSTASLSYLYTDLVEPISVANSSTMTTTGGLYSQTGINVVNFNLGTTLIDTAEIAGSLQISGGFLGQYDGSQVIEENFFLYPDNLECVYTSNSVITPTGTASNGSTTITLSSAAGVSVGMTIADTSNSSYIPAGTKIVYLSGTTATMSAATTHSISGDNLSIQGNIAAIPTGAGSAGVNYYYTSVYAWTDAQGLTHRSNNSIPVPVTTTGSGTTGVVAVSVPTLRLTYKTNVVIEIYRWSIATQLYQLVTTAVQPVLNATTFNFITFTDTLPDSAVQGNLSLYTNGGVVPNTNGPASNVMCLFDTRLWQLDAENPNTLWPSKQCIPGVPVEMSTLFKVNVSPVTGTDQNLGNASCIFPMDDKLIIFFQNGIQYLSGVGPPLTGATSAGCSLGNYSQPTFVTASVGCTNQASIVLTPQGLMFQSNKGIWLLRRDLTTSYIGDAVEAYNSYTVTSAVAVPNSTYVLFTLNSDIQLMYDYYYNQWGTFNGVSAISSCLFNGNHCVLDNYGRVGVVTPGEYLDFGNPVLLSIVTGWLNLAGITGYQRLYEFLIEANYLSPHYIQTLIAYDYNASNLHGGLIKPTNFSGSVPSGFGDPTPVGGPASPYLWRIHSKKQLCRAFQLSLTEIYDPSKGVNAGAGFTLSSFVCYIGVVKGKFPVKGANATALS